MGSSDSVTAFWEWFEAMSSRLAENPIPESLVEEVSERIDRLGHYDWEIGPSPKGDQLAFVISPGLNPELLPLTREVVALAPTLSGWKFFPARPPKAWHMKWTMHFDHGVMAFDASEWKYVLYQYDDGLVGVDLLAPNISPLLSPEDRESVAQFFLLSVLGEEAFLTKVCEWSLSNSTSLEMSKKSTDVRHLVAHLDRIVPSLN